MPGAGDPIVNRAGRALSRGSFHLAPELIRHRAELGVERWWVDIFLSGVGHSFSSVWPCPAHPEKTGEFGWRDIGLRIAQKWEMLCLAFRAGQICNIQDQLRAKMPSSERLSSTMQARCSIDKRKKVQEMWGEGIEEMLSLATSSLVTAAAFVFWAHIQGPE